MEVVHFAYALDSEHGALHRRGVEPRRHAVEREAQAVARQRPHRSDDHPRHDHPDHGIDEHPSRAGDHEPRHQDADRHQRIGRHVEVGAFHVQVALLVPHEEPRGESVHRHARTRRPGDHAALHGHRMQHAADALRHDRPHGDQQHDRVEQRDEHRALAVAVGVARPRVHPGQAVCQQGQQQARHVAQVVPGVGQQPHRVVGYAHRGLYGDECRVERDAPGESAPESRFRYGVRAPMMVVVCHAYQSPIVSLISERSTSLLTMA